MVENARATLEKRRADVAAMFDRVAVRYDLLNDVLSLGQDRAWRRRVVEALAPRPGQKVLDFRIVEAPETLEITRDPKYGRSWLYAEGKADKAKPLKVVTEFTVLRQKISGLADPAKARPLSDEDRRAVS